MKAAAGRDRPLSGVVSPSTFFLHSEASSFDFISRHITKVELVVDKQAETYLRYLQQPTAMVRAKEKEAYIRGDFDVLLFRAFRNDQSVLFSSVREREILWGRVTLFKLSTQEKAELIKFNVIYNSNSVLVFTKGPGYDSAEIGKADP